MRISRLFTMVLVILPMLLLGMTLVDVGIYSAPSIELTSIAETTPAIQEPMIEQTNTTPIIRSNDEWDDEQHQVLTAAYPHFVVSEDDISIEVFPQVLPDTIYVISDSDSGLRFRTYWHGFWHEDNWAWVEVNMSLDVQPPEETEYIVWEEASTGQYEEYGTAFADELLDLTVWFQEPGTYNARLTLFLDSVGLENDIEVSQSYSYDMTIYVLTDRPTNQNDLTVFRPAFGDLEFEGTLLNWESWNFGACNLSSEDSEITQLLDTACQATADNDIEILNQSLVAIINMQSDPLLDAQIRGQLGILNLHLQNTEVASRYFQTALDYWRIADNARMTAITLHNLGVVYMVTERTTDGQQLLMQSAVLSDLIDNHLASWLSWIQLSIIWEDWDSVEAAIEEFEEMGLPQAEAFESIVDDNR